MTASTVVLTSGACLTHHKVGTKIIDKLEAALMAAAAKGRVEMVRSFIALGADIEAQKVNTCTVRCTV